MPDGKERIQEVVAASFFTRLIESKTVDEILFGLVKNQDVQEAPILPTLFLLQLWKKHPRSNPRKIKEEIESSPPPGTYYNVDKNPVDRWSTKHSFHNISTTFEREKEDSSCLLVQIKSRKFNFDLNPPPLVEDPERFYRSGEK